MAGSAENAKIHKDILGQPLSIGDKVLYAKYHPNYYASDRHATLEFYYICGADDRFINISTKKPFLKGDVSHNVTVYDPNKSLLKWSDVIVS